MIRYLGDRGFDLVQTEDVHAKLFIADRRFAVTGSANLTDSSLYYVNDEVGTLWTDKKIIQDLVDYWDRTHLKALDVGPKAMEKTKRLMRGTWKYDRVLLP